MERELLRKEERRAPRSNPGKRRREHLGTGAPESVIKKAALPERGGKGISGKEEG